MADSNISRRQAMLMSVAAAAAALASGAATADQCGDDRVGKGADAQTWAEERRKVIGLGFTADEADCWVLVGRAAQKFFELPKLHETADKEVAEAIHVIQYRLMSRPTYRRYLGRDGAARQ